MQGSPTKPSTEAETVTTAEAVITRLEDHGVRHVFGIPGTHNLALYRHLQASSIQHVTPRHEQGAGYAADGYARAGGRPGVCLLTSGPALLNAATAAAQAYSDSIPILIVSPAMPTEAEGRDGGFLHELRDQHGVMQRLIGRSERVLTPAEAATAIDRAFSEFAGGRPRPVHVEIPLDHLERPGRRPPAPVAAPTRPAADPALVERAARLLAEAQTPALILGGGAVDAADEALALANRLQAAVVTTINGKGVVSERDPLSLGASIRLDACKRFLRACDVVLAVGTELAESDLWEPPPLALDGTLIRVDVDPAQLQKNSAAELGILADAAPALRAILESVDERARPPVSLDSAREAIARDAHRDGQRYAELIAAMQRALPADAIVAGDSAQACYYGFAHFFAAVGPRQFLYPTGLATLGYGLPAGLGAKLALPERAVAVLIGDGGLMFTLAELATAVEQRLALPIVVVENGGYGEIRRQMLELDIPPLGVDLAAVDLVALGRAFGARAYRARDPDELAPRLSEALEADGPTLIVLTVPD